MKLSVSMFSSSLNFYRCFVHFTHNIFTNENIVAILVLVKLCEKMETNSYSVFINTHTFRSSYAQFSFSLCIITLRCITLQYFRELKYCVILFSHSDIANFNNKCWGTRDKHTSVPIHS